MMDTFDVALIDLQDVGCRIYTFVTTLLYMLEAAAQHDKSVWILDRPNPVGRPIEGLRLRKGCESFGPLGPWMVTKDEIKDPQDLNMELTVNGEVRQKGNTKTMIFGVAHLVWACSQYFILEPGDVIITGTPPGVGSGKKPPRFLNPGDVVTLGVDGLGTQRQQIVAA